MHPKSGLILGILSLITLPAMADTLRFTTDETLQREFPEVHAWLTRSYAQLGYDVAFQVAPARRGLIESNSRRWDGEVLRIAGIEDIAPNLLRLPTPLAEAPLVLFQQKQLPRLSAHDLENRQIAAPLGYVFVDRLRVQYGFEIVETGSVEKALKMTDLGRADATFFLEDEGKQLLLHLHLDNVTTYGEPIVRLPLFHYVHKKHQALIPELMKLRPQDLTDQ